MTNLQDFSDRGWSLSIIWGAKCKDQVAGKWTPDKLPCLLDRIHGLGYSVNYKQVSTDRINFKSTNRF